jgi:ParB family chromosome partitioning protein
VQPRKQFDEIALEELASSIRAQGVLQPIVVRRSGDHYEIVAGERRWRAAARAGLHEIPAVIKDYTESQALQVALIENLQRQDLDPIEEAEGYRRLIDEHALTHEQIADAVGKSRVAITNSLRLLKLPRDLLEKLTAGELTAGHARALMSMDSDDTARRALADDIIQRGLTVREAEHAVRQRSEKSGKNLASKQSIEERDIEARLQRALGTRVSLQQRQGKGKIEIYFHSFQELDAILERVCST